MSDSIAPGSEGETARCLEMLEEKATSVLSLLTCIEQMTSMTSKMSTNTTLGSLVRDGHGRPGEYETWRFCPRNVRKRHPTSHQWDKHCLDGVRSNWERKDTHFQCSDQGGFLAHFLENSEFG